MNENIVNEGVKFSKENQPDPIAKSEGVKAWWKRQNLKNDLFNEFAKPLLNAAGIENPTFEQGIKLYKKALFSTESELSDHAKADAFLRLCDFLCEKESKITSDQPIVLTISKEDANL